MKKRLLFLLILGLQAMFSFAQNYPVRVTPQVIPPYPASFSGYADTKVMNSPVRVQLTLNDITSPARTIRLKVSITGNGIQATSTPLVVGAPNLVLDAGVPLQLSITELAPYFRLENLQGISSAQYNSTLPDGTYRFCFEVFDVFTGNRLSGTSCATVFLINNDPPFLNKPDNESRIAEQNPTNIVFQWTPRHINVPNVSYEFSIVEVWDTYVNPQTIFVSSPPLYQEITTQTSILYGPLQPLLLPGKRYAWRVRAFATNNGEEVSVFNNYGNSEIFWFDYQKNCDLPTQVKVEDVQLSRATISWIGHPDHLDYTVHYRESGSEQWYTKTTPRDYITIDEFKPDTVYEYKVSGNCEVDSFGVSQVESFKTLSKELSEYTACGIEADPVDLSNQELLTALYPDDIFTAGDFPVYVKKVTSSGGSFTGEGYISTPWLATVRIPVTFDNIQINTDYQLVAGLVRTTYDPNWDSIIDADDIIEEIVGDDGDVDVIKVDANITDVQVGDDGKITIITSDGVKIEQPGGEDVVYVDNTGETWSVSEDGKVTKGQMAEGGPATASNTAGVGSGGVNEITATEVEVTFVKSGYYAFDEFPKNAGGTLADQYDTVAKGKKSYPIPYKAVSNLGKHTSDVIEAQVVFNNSEYSKDDIVFKTKEGIKIPFTWNKSSDIATLSIKKQFDFGKQQIIATLKPKDTTQKYTVAGAVNLWHLASQKVTDIDVTIIPVNGASVSKSIGQQINEIYNPAGVNFKVSVANSFKIDQAVWDLNGNGVLDIGDSGALAHYSEEERTLRSYFKTQHSYNPKTYYVFVLGDDMQPSKIGTKGFMPLKRQFGFIFDQKDPAHTIAHELGHGIFGLEHPFIEYNTTQTTNLLMDYGTGTDFTHMDWEKMHAPGIQLYLFQDDEDGEKVGDGHANYICINTELKGELLRGGYHFLDMKGDPIALDIDNLPFAFMASDEGKYYGRLGAIGHNGHPYLYGVNKKDGKPIFSGRYVRNKNDKITPTKGAQSKAVLVQIDKKGNYKIKHLSGKVLKEGKTKEVDCPFSKKEKNDLKKDNLIAKGFSEDKIILFLSEGISENDPKYNEIKKLAKYLKSILDNVKWTFLYKSTSISEKSKYPRHYGHNLLLHVLKDKKIYTVSDFKTAFKYFKYSADDPYYIKDIDVLIANFDPWEGVPKDYNRHSFDYTSFEVPNLMNEETIVSQINVIEDLFTAIVKIHPNYFTKKQKKKFVEFINYRRTKEGISNVLKQKLSQRKQFIAAYQALGAYEKYHYSIKDLKIREFLKEGNFLKAIKSNEAAGKAIPIHQAESYDQYVALHNSNSAFFYGVGYLKMFGDLLEFEIIGKAIAKAQKVLSKTFKKFKIPRRNKNFNKDLIAVDNKVSGFNKIIKEANQVVKSNVQRLRKWAKNKGFSKKGGSGSNSDTPEVWGTYKNGEFSEKVVFNHLEGELKVTIKNSDDKLLKIKFNDGSEVSANNIPISKKIEDVFSQLDFSRMGIRQAIQHVKFRDFNVARKKGIGGCHDASEWAKIRQRYVGSYTVPVNKRIDDPSVPEIIVRKITPHPTVPGVKRVEYSIPAIDGKFAHPVTKKAVGNTTGGLKDIKDPKTIYDPAIWTDDKLERLLKEALDDVVRRKQGIPREWTGVSSDGYRMRGYYDNGKITSFYFD